MLDQLDRQLRDTEEECRAYKDFLEQLESEETEINSQEYDDSLQQVLHLIIWISIFFTVGFSVRLGIEGN